MTRLVPNFGNLKPGGVDAQSFTPNNIEQFGMIGKVAYQIIREVVAKNPLSSFDFIPVDNGDTIEESIVKLVESQAYDPSGSHALVPDTTVKMAVRYYKNWIRKKFPTTVNISELRKALISEKSAEEVAKNIVAVLSQSDIYDKFLDVKALLAYGKTAGSASDGTNSVFIHGTDQTVTNKDYSNVIKYIKDTCDGFDFVSANYNRAGILRRNDKSDIRILMPYTLKNAIDVDTLTGYFNLNKGEIDQVIIPLDTTDNTVYIVDKMAVQVVTRLYEMMDQKNSDAGTWNYFLHVERQYILCELFNGIYFDVTVQ